MFVCFYAAECIVVDSDQWELPAVERGAETQVSAGRTRQTGDVDWGLAVQHWRRIESLARTYRYVFHRAYRPCHLHFPQSAIETRATLDDSMTRAFNPFDAHCCHMGYSLRQSARMSKITNDYGLTACTGCFIVAIKHPVPDAVKPSSFVIFDIRALWRSGLRIRVPGCQKLQMTA